MYKLFSWAVPTAAFVVVVVAAVDLSCAAFLAAAIPVAAHAAAADSAPGPVSAPAPALSPSSSLALVVLGIAEVKEVTAVT